jgi:hypothetical protein
VTTVQLHKYVSEHYRLWNLKFQHRAHMSLLSFQILSQWIQLYLFKISLNIILFLVARSPNLLFLCKFFVQSVISISHFLHVFYILSHLILRDLVTPTIFCEKCNLWIWLMEFAQLPLPHIQVFSSASCFTYPCRLFFLQYEVHIHVNNR